MKFFQKKGGWERRKKKDTKDKFRADIHLFCCSFSFISENDDLSLRIATQ